MSEKHFRSRVDSDLKALHQRVTAFCEQGGYDLSPQAQNILKDIVRMKQAAGDFYCACQVQQLPETVCVCEAVRQGLVDVMGACFCDLIRAKNSKILEEKIDA